MKLYDEKEKQRIKSLEIQNDQFEQVFEDARAEWSKKIDPLFQVIKGSLSSSDSDRILNSQAFALSYRQQLQEEISKWLNKISKENSSLKLLKAQKFIHFSTGFGMKTNSGEKTILIEGNLRENQRTIQILQNYVQFLRECVENLVGFGYSVKNIISLLDYLSK